MCTYNVQKFYKFKIIKFIDYFFDVHFMYFITLGLPGTHVISSKWSQSNVIFFSVFTSIDNGLYIHNLLQGEILEEIVA